MELSDAFKLGISLVSCLAAGGIGSIFTSRSIPTWYAAQKKPPYTPPNRVFGPVWTTLYIMMGVSVFLVWSKGLGAEAALAGFSLFWAQLAVNIAWSAVFFTLKSRIGGLVTIIVLWLLILATLIFFFMVSVVSGALLVPYLAWVTVATYLNGGLWILNRQTDR